MSDVLSALDRTECLALLSTTNYGQVALTRRALPAVVPARYVVHDRHIIVHLSTGIDHVRWVDGEIVTLHVTAFDDDQRHGWSVSVTGATHGTSGSACTNDIPIAPWIADGNGDLITLDTDLVVGEHLGPTYNNHSRP